MFQIVHLFPQDDDPEDGDVTPRNLESVFEDASKEAPAPQAHVAPIVMVPVIIAPECDEIPLSQPRGDLDELNAMAMEVPTPEVPATKPEAEDPEEDLEAEMEKAQPPPSRMGEQKMKSRLRRVFLPRADGSYKVPEDLLAEYQNLNTRPRVNALFAKVGYCPDWVANTWKKHMQTL